MESESTIEYGFKKWVIAITVIVCSLLELIDTSIVNVATTQLMGNLGATLSEVSWVIAAYGIANVIIVPMSGWLSAQFGRKNYFAFSIVVFTVASFLCGNSTSIWELVAFRFIQGIGGGALLATSQTILFETFPPEQKGLASALYGIGVLMGPTLGPTIGGYIIDDYNWPFIFYVNIPVGILAVILTLKFIKNPAYMKGNRTPASEVDWLGIGLLILGVGSLQLILEQGEREDWFASSYISNFTVVAVLGIIGFIWRELTAKKPIVDLRVLKNRNLALGVLFSFILGFGLFSSVFVIPVFVQSMLGFTALQTGLMLIPGAIASGFMMPLVGKMIQKGVSQKYMIAAGFAIFGTFTFWVYRIITPQAGQEAFFYPLLLRGLGLGLLFVPIATFSLSALKGKDIAQGAGLTAMVRQLGGSFGVAIVSSFIASRALSHRNNLISHLSAYDFSVQERLKQLTQYLSAGSGDVNKAQQQAYKILDLSVMKQSFILTYMDTFFYLGVFFLCCLPLVFLIRNTKVAKVDISAAH